MTKAKKDHAQPINAPNFPTEPPKQSPLNADEIRIYLASVPRKYRKLVLKAMTGKASPRMAIKAQCYQCVGYSDVKNMVYNCSSRICSLWRYRPRRE